MNVEKQFHQAQQQYLAGMVDAAEAAFRALLAASPHHPGTLLALGNLLQSKGKLHEAIDCWMKASAISDIPPITLCNLGVALALEDRLEEAERYLRLATQLKPDYFHALGNLGSVMQRKCRFDEAIALHRRALAIQPEFTPSLTSLADALYAAGDVDAAIDHYRKALILRPDAAEIHLSLAGALLCKGDFQEGWREYRWRWRAPSFPSPRVTFPGPSWDGTHPAGRTILVHTEQGFGDAIQFVRFAALLQARGARVILACPPQLVRLFREVRGIDVVVTTGDALEPYDAFCSLLDLPRLLNVDVVESHWLVPYVRADATLVEEWKARVPGGTWPLKIGVVSRGRTQRQLQPGAWSALLQLENVWACSLQNAEASDPGVEHLRQWPEAFVDFADTAALIDCLDLVVTVDTAVAHLAGAMGKPVWILLNPPIDWRWMRDRNDSPWYPTARLFRIKPGDAPTAAIETMIEQLRLLLGGA